MRSMKVGFSQRIRTFGKRELQFGKLDRRRVRGRVDILISRLMQGTNDIDFMPSSLSNGSASGFRAAYVCG